MLVSAEVVADGELLPRCDPDARLPHLDLDAEPLERRQDRDQILRANVVDRHVAAGDRREADEAPDFDVLGADPPFAAGEGADALDPEHVRLDPLDPGTE
jgi:hypothetical protein